MVSTGTVTVCVGTDVPEGVVTVCVGSKVSVGCVGSVVSVDCEGKVVFWVVLPGCVVGDAPWAQPSIPKSVAVANNTDKAFLILSIGRSITYRIFLPLFFPYVLFYALHVSL